MQFQKRHLLGFLQKMSALIYGLNKHTDGEIFVSPRALPFLVKKKQDNNKGFLKCRYFYQMIHYRPFILVKVGLFLFIAKRHKWQLYKYPSLISCKQNFKKTYYTILKYKNEQYLCQVSFSQDCLYAPAVFVRKPKILKILSRENCHYM